MIFFALSELVLLEFAKLGIATLCVACYFIFSVIMHKQNGKREDLMRKALEKASANDAKMCILFQDWKAFYLNQFMTYEEVEEELDNTEEEGREDGDFRKGQ